MGVKALAAKLKLSTALVYKWCQESPRDEPASSGACNPLDRLKDIYDVTGDAALINWLCSAANGFFVPNSQVQPGEKEEQLLGTTQRMVEEFGELLADISRSIENDGRITREEADQIRQSWETLKSQTECFVVACERGLYGGRPQH